MNKPPIYCDRRDDVDWDMSDSEIFVAYRDAANKKDMLEILADRNLTNKRSVAAKLQRIADDLGIKIEIPAFMRRGSYGKKEIEMILSLTAEGKSEEQIAATIGRTTESLKRWIKLNLNSDGELITAETPAPAPAPAPEADVEPEVDDLAAAAEESTPEKIVVPLSVINALSVFIESVDNVIEILGKRLEDEIRKRDEVVRFLWRCKAAEDDK